MTRRRYDSTKDSRCRFTWNPGKWPYITRCPQPGVEPVPEFNDERGALFCGHHARQLKRQLKEELPALPEDQDWPPL